MTTTVQLTATDRSRVGDAGFALLVAIAHPIIAVLLVSESPHVPMLFSDGNRSLWDDRAPLLVGVLVAAGACWLTSARWAAGAAALGTLLCMPLSAYLIIGPTAVGLLLGELVAIVAVVTLRRVAVLRGLPAVVLGLALVLATAWVVWSIFPGIRT